MLAPLSLQLKSKIKTNGPLRVQQPGTVRARPRWPTGCARGLRRVRRAGAHRRRGHAAAPRHRGRPADLDHPVGAAGPGKTTLATSSRTAPPATSPAERGAGWHQRPARGDRAAKERREMHGLRTVLFVDEIHRWNKAQQDALLPHVEDGRRDPGRCDDRESDLRGDPTAVLPLARVSSCARSATTTCAPCWRGRWRHGSAGLKLSK